MWRAVAVIAVLSIAAFTYPGAIAVALIVRLTPAPTATSPAPPGVLPWLHVEHPGSGIPYIADDRGRMVLLHGATPDGLIDFRSNADPASLYPPPYYPIDPAAYDGRCPENSTTITSAPLCEKDLEQMAALGFNSMRLPLSWSLLEPERGHFNQMYVDRIAQVVDWARPLGIYVIIDMHQNAYSRYLARPSPPPWPGGTVTDLSADTGAPAWATITDGFPSEVYRNQRELNPASMEANTNFWYDRSGIQEEYIAAVAYLARRFKNDSTVAGYSLFNEPWPGWNLPPGFEDLLLFPFYRRVIDAITGVHDGLPCWTGFYMPAICGYRDLGVHDLRHIVFVDTGLLREVTDFPTHLGLPLSSYPNLVLAMHAYTHGYTVDALLNQKPPQATYPWGGYDQTYSLAEDEVKAMGSALMVMEFGNGTEWDPYILTNELLEQERHRVGFAFWVWKENGAWGVYATPNGCLRSGRERLLARVYPRASADPLLTYHYDPGSGAFALSAQGRASDAPTVVYIPPEVAGNVVASGAVVAPTITANSDGSRIVTASPTGGGFSISVSAAPLNLTGCP